MMQPMNMVCKMIKAVKMMKHNEYDRKPRFFFTMKMLKPWKKMKTDCDEDDEKLPKIMGHDERSCNMLLTMEYDKK